MATHPEALLISAVVRTGDYQPLAATGITHDLFHVYVDEAQWLERYITKHGKAPSKAALKAKFPDFTVYRVDDVAHWCDEVHQEHTRYELLLILDESMSLLDQDAPDQAIANMAARLSEVRMQAMGKSPAFDVFESWEETYETVNERVNRVQSLGFAGVPTGFKTLDAITGGLQPGWLCIMGARLGVGKTWGTVKMATHAAVLGFKVCYFSLEQSRNQIAMRVHSFASKQFNRMVFNSMDLGRGHGFDIRAYKEFLRDLQNRVQGSFTVHDGSRGPVTAQSVIAAIEAEQPDVTFIDYLQRLQGDRKGDDWQVMGRLSGQLQDAGQQFDKPIVAGAQINRMGAVKDAPDAEHIALADKIGQDADLLVTMFSPSQHVMKMKGAKFRHGPSGFHWYCHFDPGAGIFDEVSGDKAKEIQEKDNEVD